METTTNPTEADEEAEVEGFASIGAGTQRSVDSTPRRYPMPLVDYGRVTS